MNKRSIGLLGAVVAIVLFFGINVLANAALRGVRIDLTEENLYTLSDGSKNIARKVDEPIRLYFYYSESGGRDFPQIKDYAGRVRDVLDEFVSHSNGNLILEVINPEPFSEEEERAVREGILALPLPNGDPLYFGLVGTSATDDREVMPYFDAFDPGKQRFLEYDLSRMIYTLAHPEKNKIVVLSSLPIEGMPPNPMMQQQQGPPRWKILDHLGSFFDVESMDPTATALPEDTDVLVLVHPKNISEATLYAIDQFVLGGGKLVAFVDPHCEADPDGQQNPMQQPQPGATAASNLNQLFQAWGFESVPNKVAGDRLNALRVQYPDGQRMKEGPFVVWLGLREDALDGEDAITSQLKELRINSPGILRATGSTDIAFTPLIQTSEESMEIDAGMLQFRPNPDSLMRNFVPGFQKLTLGARVTGTVSSAFPQGDPAAAEPPVDDPATEEDESASGPDASHLGTSNGPINVIAVADVDFLADRQWVQEQRLFNLSLGLTKISDNGDFLVNAIENLMGGEDLISIQSRGNYSRPFERVEQIRLDAEQRFRSEEMELERKLQEVTRRIQELQTDAAPGSAVLLPDDLADQIAQAKQDELDTKRALRNVQLDMRKDIEGLGNKLKWMNIGLLPVLVSAAAIALGAWRVQRRTSR